MTAAFPLITACQAVADSRMNTKNTRVPRIIKVVLILLAMGAVFRLANLDLKVYGHDASHTLRRFPNSQKNSKI